MAATPSASWPFGAIDAGADARVIARTVGILATARAVAVVHRDELVAARLEVGVVRRGGGILRDGGTRHARGRDGGKQRRSNEKHGTHFVYSQET